MSRIKAMLWRPGPTVFDLLVRDAAKYLLKQKLAVIFYDLRYLIDHPHCIVYLFHPYCHGCFIDQLSHLLMISHSGHES